MSLIHYKPWLQLQSISLCNVAGGSMTDAFVTTTNLSGEVEPMISPPQVVMDDICLATLRNLVMVSRRPRSYRIEISRAQLMEERLQREKVEQLRKELKKPMQGFSKKATGSNPENLKRKRHSGGIKFYDHHSAADMTGEEDVRVEEKDDDYRYNHHHSRRPKKVKKEPLPKPQKKLMRRATDQYQGPEPPPDMPPDLRELITSMKGESPTLVIQKALNATDTSRDHHRLSMSVKSVRNEFFTPKEKEEYMTRTEEDRVRTVYVRLFDPMMRVRRISFKMWEMKKENKRKASSWNYVFGSPWLQVIDENGLEINDVVQLWAFRIESELF